MQFDVGRDLARKFGNANILNYQGIGAAMYEEMKYDDEGQLLTPTLMDYKIPSVNETPDIHLDHIVTPSPFTPLGTKGAGETGMLGVPPAIASAIEDALLPQALVHGAEAAARSSVGHVPAWARAQEGPFSGVHGRAPRRHRSRCRARRARRGRR